MELHDTTIERRGGVVHHRTQVRFRGDKLPAGSVTYEIPARWSHWVARQVSRPKRPPSWGHGARRFRHSSESR